MIEPSQPIGEERQRVFRSLVPGWARIYRPFAREVKRHAFNGTTTMIASAAFEALGIAALGLAATRTDVSPAEAFVIAGAIAAALMLSSLMKGLSDEQLAVGQIALETSLRTQVTDAILNADWQDFVDQPGHELQSAALSEAPQVASATITFVRGRGAIGAAIVMFVSTIFVSPIAVVICGLFGVVIVLVYKRSSRGLRSAQQELAEGTAELTRHTSILISGLRSLRLSPVQAIWRDDLEAEFDRVARARRRDLLIPVRGRLLVDVISSLMIFAVLVTQVAISGDLIPGLIVMALILRVIPRVQTAQQQLAFAQHGASWIERWNTRLAALTDAPRLRFATTESAATNAPEQVVLAVQHVYFSYQRHHRPVLSNVDLDLRRGEWVSLRGVSGGGKSTLIDVIGGILTPNAGTVSLEGVPIEQVDKAVRFSTLVIVPQDVHLFGNTTDEIVTWGGRLRDVGDVATITKALGVDEMFLFGEHEGSGKVDEMSRDISGGMRTRLAMARALASRPSVLILDETTSRLHPEAESEIFGAIRTLRPDLAVLVVTHRPETTCLVDRRLELVDGRLHAA